VRRKTEPAFVARPPGAPVYHGFEVMSDVVVEGFTFGKITDFDGKFMRKATPLRPHRTAAELAWFEKSLTNPTFKRFVLSNRNDGEFGASPFLIQ
jgi:hypothetical protein